MRDTWDPQFIPGWLIGFPPWAFNDMHQIPQAGGELTGDAHSDFVEVHAAHNEFEPAFV